MNRFLSVFFLQLWEVRNSRAYPASIVIGLLYIYYCMTAMEFAWAGSVITGVRYLVDTDPDFFRATFTTVYYLEFFCLVSAGGSFLILNRKDSLVALLRTKPVHPFSLVTVFWLSTALILFAPLAIIHLVFWLSMGIAYQVWSAGMILALWPLLILCLLVSSALLFFAGASGNIQGSVFLTLTYLLILPAVLSLGDQLPLPGREFADFLVPDTGRLMESAAGMFSGAPVALEWIMEIPLYILFLAAAAAWQGR